ncbi:hypothetical protein BDV19DRAFT_75487 [Aspergillus venezuelensis]
MAACYDRDGNEDVTRLPCSNNGTLAQCCSDGELCASNGLCVRTEDDGDTSYWQNTCSDPDWMDGNVTTCPTQCMDIRNAGNGVTACGSGTWCCTGFSGCDCNNSTQTFELDPVRIVTSVTTATSSTTTSTSSTTTSSATDTPTSTPTDPSDSGSSGDSDSNLGIGLGVGLGVGIPLVLGAIVAFWFFRRRKRAAAAAAAGSGSDAAATAPLAGAGGMENYQPTPQDKRFAQQEVDAARYAPPTELPARQATQHVAELQ